MLPKEAWQEMFEKELKDDPYVPQPIATMSVIQKSLLLDDSTTLQEIVERMRFVREALCNCKSANVAVESSGELFLRFITRAPTAIENAKSFDEVREILISRGEDFISNVKQRASEIARVTLHMFRENLAPVLITHSRSQCVLEACIEALHKGHRFTVFVTEGQPQCHGQAMVRELRGAGIHCELVLDAAAAYYVERSTLAVVGAEAVCVNGGVIAKIGTASITAAAKLMHRPVNVLVESYKFTYHTPLNNRSLSIKQMYGPRVTCKPLDVSPSVDYTPPDHISSLYTDVGLMHTTSVCDVLAAMFT